jgi:hypothetical protein
MQGPLDVRGSNIAVYGTFAAATAYITDVTFSGFGAAPIAMHGGVAYLERCTFTALNCPGVSIHSFGESFVSHVG